MPTSNTSKPTATNNTLKIAIDGPAGAGKSTVAKLLAEKLNLLYIDTGAMYRAVAWIARENNISLKDGSRIAEEVKNKRLHFHAGPARDKVLVDDIDISIQIRSPEISNNVSHVATLPEVRSILVEQQRLMAEDVNCVLDGRDIGTVVLPDANPKIFLTASKEERAKRRVLDLANLGKPQDFEEVLKAMNERDKRDSTRSQAPLVKAPDAIEVKTDGLSINEVVDKIAELVEDRKEVTK